MSTSEAGARPGRDQPADLESLQPRYEWRLRELMAVRRHWYTTTKLIPELQKHGIILDRSTAYRLVRAGKPPKMSIELILALCKILDCRFEDLVAEIPAEQDQPAPRTGPRPVLPDGPLLAGEFFAAES